VRNDYFSGLVYFIFLFWVLTKKGTREMKPEYYLFIAGVALGWLLGLLIL